MRCPRCGRTAAETDKFCAECGMFLRDPFLDQRILMALGHNTKGDHRETRMALTPEYLMARYHIGVIHERLGDLDAAEREFQRSLEEGVGEVSSVHHLAHIRRSRGDDEGADELLQRARQFARTNAS